MSFLSDNLFRFNYQVLATVLVSVATLIFLCWFHHKNRKKSISTTNKFNDHDVYNFCSNPKCLRCSGKISKQQLAMFFSQTVENNPKLLNIKTWFDTEVNKSADEKQKPTVFFLPNLRTSAITSSSVYESDVSLLESKYDVIMEEFLNIAESTSGWKINTTPTGTWKVFYLYNQGQKISINTSCCPQTVEVLKSLKNFLRNCAFGNACFSVLKPGSNISAHYGPCNVRIRCHLGLRIPKKWSLQVDTKTLTWKEKKCILFDDSYLHSVSHQQNTTNLSSRVIFMTDLWHYNVTVEERDFICKMFPPR